jgi:acyl transferase domain-containing protein/thioesterase domain-containing protein/SAM-dependent methyltransferase/acyl carrier protein
MYSHHIGADPADINKAFVSVESGPSTSTITLPQRDLSEVTAKLEARSVMVRKLDLHGRFHSPALSRAAHDLNELCDARSDLRFKMCSQNMLTVRSGLDGNPTAMERVHQQVISDIILSPSKWYTILSTKMRGVQDVRGEVLCIGRDNPIPDTMVRAQGTKVHQARDYLFDRYRRTKSLTYPDDAVAVVGMGCKFPGAGSTNEFWELLKRGQVMASRVPVDRFPSDLWGNFVEDVASFDHKFFGKSPREAAAMDPQQRLLLEVAYQAIESAGWFGSPGSRPLDEKIGCFIGCGSSDYSDNMAGHAPGAFSILGALRGLLSGRVSHHFNWGGPSITYDTACASSMAAMHAACQALQLRECDAAVAGGVNVITSPNFYNALDAAGFLSKTGPSRAFEERADGYCRGEGAGLVVLKRLDDALAHGDDVLGVISATAIMQNQSEATINVPSVASQAKLFRSVVDRAQLDASDISFVEAHGTGTQVGDCIEAESVRQVFGSDRTSTLYLGSVKDNIGHTEGAAGVAGLIKTVLMMRHGVIIAQPNFDRLNPKIRPHHNIEIARTVQPWSRQVKAACINNYGAGGCNGALIICSRPPALRRSCDLLKTSPVSHYPIFISAKSITSLRVYCSKLKQWLELQQPYLDKPQLLADVAFRLSRTQKPDFQYAVTFVAISVSHLCEKLTLYVSEQPSSILGYVVPKVETKPVVLVFGGQTGRSACLSTEFVQSCTLLRSHLGACDQALQQLGHKSIFPSIFRKANGEDQDLVNAHSVLFSVQYATARCWLDSGVCVAALLGHSFGQLTALCVGGVLSLEDALKFVVRRALLIQKYWHEDRGAMVAIEAEFHNLSRLVDSVNLKFPDRKIEVACYNGPTSFVLAGPTVAIDSVGMLAASLSGFIKVKKLEVPFAFHSYLTDPVLPGLAALAEELHYQTPHIRIETCSDTTSWSSVKPSMLVHHTRSPVFFGQATKRLEAELGSCIWLEADFGSPIIGMVRRSLPKGTIANHVFHAIKLDGSAKELANITKSLFEESRHFAFWPFHPSDKDRYNMVDLPPYQFERNHHWLPYIDLAISNKPIENIPQEAHYLTFRGFSDNSRRAAIFNIDSRSERLQLLVKGHAVLDTPLCPASAYVDLASQAAVLLEGGEAKAVLPQLEDLRIEAPLGLDDSSVITLSLTRLKSFSNAWAAQFESAKTKCATIIHARVSVYLRTTSSTPPPAFSSFNRLIDAGAPEQLLQDQHAQSLSGPVIYALFGKTVTYDGFYRGLKKIASAERETAALIVLPRTELTSLCVSPCDPIAMDNFLQVAGIHVNFLHQALNDEVFIANHIDNIMLGSGDFLSNPEREFLVYAKYSEINDRAVTSDIFVFSKASRELRLVLLGVRFTRVQTKTLTKVLRGANTSLNGEESVMVSTPNSRQKPRVSHSVNTDHPVSTEDNQHASLCGLLSELLDVPTEQIARHTMLADLGIDSLMMTEVATSIRKTFNITIATSELQTLQDVQALSDRLFPRSSRIPPLQARDSPIQDLPNISSSATSTPPSTAISSLDPDVATVESSTTEISDSLVEAFQKIGKQFDLFAAESSFLGYWEDVYPLHVRLVTTYITEAFAALGCSIDRLSAGAPLPVVGVHVRHEKLHSRLLEILAKYDLVCQSPNGDFMRSSQVMDTTNSETLHARILQQSPLYASEHQLLRSTGKRLAECLKGDVDAVDLLFGSKTSRDLLQDVYANAPVFKTATSMLARLLVDTLDTAPPTGPIQILEIGAGTGGTTMFLVNELLRARIDFVYTFTDLSPSLVSKARKMFSGIENMRFQVLDIERPVSAELCGLYQTVISTNCIHATSDLVYSCQNIQNLLAPNGFLALVELTRKMAWFDVVFGLLDGWWAFTDDRTHALVDEHVWDRKLRSAGFRHVEWSSGESKESSNIRIICGFKRGMSNVSTPALNKTLSPSVYKATSVLIQGSASDCMHNIFAFPGGFGTAATYTPLPIITTSIALYGLNSPFLKDPSAFNVSLGELTRIYLDEIRRIQATGPYTLMGYSVGGVMAYEAARQLIDQGEQVSQLILLDSACPALIPPFPISLLDFLDSIDRFKGTDDDAQNAGVQAQASDKPAGSANGAKKMTDPHVIATLQSLHKYDPVCMPAEQSPRTLLIAARHGIDRLKKVPRPKVTDLEQKVIEWVLNDRRDFTPCGFGWDRLIDSDMINVVPVDGNHFSLLTEPFVSILFPREK